MSNESIDFSESMQIFFTRVRLGLLKLFWKFWNMKETLRTLDMFL